MGFSTLKLLLMVDMLVLCSCQTGVPLRAFCAHKTDDSTQYAASSAFVQMYLRICRDVDTFTDCILKYRAQSTPGVYVEPYEVYFPVEYDIKRASYHFCAQAFPGAYKALEDDPQKTESCTKEVATTCEGQFTQSQLDGIERAVKGKNAESARNISCDIQAGIKNCEVTKLYECSKSFEQIKNYELAMLGGECLVKHGIYSPYVTVKLCAVSATPTTNCNSLLLILLTVLSQLIK